MQDTLDQWEEISGFGYHVRYRLSWANVMPVLKLYADLGVIEWSYDLFLTLNRFKLFMREFFTQKRSESPPPPEGGDTDFPSLDT